MTFSCYFNFVFILSASALGKIAMELQHLIFDGIIII